MSNNTNELLRALVDLRDRQIQKARIQFGNRINAIVEGSDPSDGQQLEILRAWADRFSDLEGDLDKEIASMVSEYPIYDYITAVRGVGPMLAAKLIAMIDIERANTVSALWRYAGYAVIDGVRERPTKGEALHYNNRLKTACYNLGTSLLRSASPYRREYDEAREYYAEHRPDWTKAHQHNAAMRKMIKLFLSHLWVVWRELEGLPTRQPYAHEYMDHTTIKRPEDYGWPVFEEA
jgi:hypothetical protein